MQQEEKTFTATDPEKTVTLNPTLTIHATVVDDETGKPVESFRVFRGAFWSGRTTPAWVRNAREIPTKPGAFEIKESTEQSAYAVVVEALGYQPTESRLIKPGETTASLEFRLKKGPDLAATILAPDGKPLADADVLLATESGQILIDNGAVDDISTQCQRIRTDAAGRFRTPAQAGPLRLIVVHPASYLVLKPEGLKDNPTITAPAWARIEGTARIGATPAAGAQVEAFFDTTSVPRGIASSLIPTASATVDAQGHYVLDRVQPGKVWVSIKHKSANPRPAYYAAGLSLRRTVEVPAGQTARLDLGGTGRAVSGRLVLPLDLANRADPYYAHAQLTMKKPADNDYFFLSHVTRDGAFRFDDVPPGDYEFTATYLTPARASNYSAGPPLATLTMPLTLPDTKDTRTTEPLDLGALKLAPPLEANR